MTIERGSRARRIGLPDIPGSAFRSPGVGLPIPRR